MSEAAHLVAVLKATGEITRLRILALLAEGELSVKDFTEILGQSQPRISRHLKLLTDAGVITRHAEGAWAYFRLAEEGLGARLAPPLISELDGSDPQFRRDRERLSEVRAQHKAQAARYFALMAESWDLERSLHVPEAAVEAAITEAAKARPVATMLDLGTGTGRMLELLAPHYARGIGIDASREMLAIARAKLNSPALAHGQVRLGDIGNLGEYAKSADLAVLHQVLHYFDDPGRIIAEAETALRPGGRMIIVDFAPHSHRFLNTEHAHQRLGLSDGQMNQWARAAGLSIVQALRFPDDTGEGLTVCLWSLEAVGRAEERAHA